ncbi:MAG TPA: ABC transporter substrate-binding protein, partial [Thermodesulfobacteriota bacterium]|nr:ABC transporter substrate-binding protein [Thermodesulfobacteriota bacterium]
MLRKRFIGMGVVSAILLVLTPAFAQEAYQVGCSMAVTGPGAEIYGALKDAIDIYFKEVNARGGINGHPAKIIIEDDAAEPSKAATNAKKLVTQDKVLLLLNGSLSSTYAPMIQVAQQFKVPLLFAGGVCPADVYPPK